MASPKKPGTNVGKQGGIYQDVGPKGGVKPTRNSGGHKPLPPTTKPGHGWSPVNKTPDSHR